MNYNTDRLQTLKMSGCLM